MRLIIVIALCLINGCETKSRSVSITIFTNSTTTEQRSDYFYHCNSLKEILEKNDVVVEMSIDSATVNYPKPVLIDVNANGKIKRIEKFGTDIDMYNAINQLLSSKN